MSNHKMQNCLYLLIVYYQLNQQFPNLNNIAKGIDAFSKIDIFFVILDAVQDKYCLAKQNVDVKAVLTILSDLKSIDLNCLIDIYSGCARQDCLNSFMDNLDRLYKKYSETGGNDG